MTWPDAWSEIEWGRARKHVKSLQRQLQRHVVAGDRRNERSAVGRIYASKSAALLAVRQVTEKNDGRHTPGVDGVAKLTGDEKIAMARDLAAHSSASPYRLASVPKASGGERLLRVPVMADRARMVLLKLALQPLIDQRLHPQLFGARQGSGLYHAYAEVARCIYSAPKFVARADIHDFFDSVRWDCVIDALQLSSRFEELVMGWLAAPTVDGARLEYPSKGVAQGAPIAPILAHATLAGLHNHLRRSSSGESVPDLLIYVDDIAIIGASKQATEGALRVVEEWLSSKGYEFSPGKTSTKGGPPITTTAMQLPQDGDGGFEYLGVRFVQWPHDPELEYRYEAYLDGYIDSEAEEAGVPPPQSGGWLTEIERAKEGTECFSYADKGIRLKPLLKATAGLAHVRTETCFYY